MQSLLFHPKVVHLPLALGVLMPLVTAGVALAWWRRWLPARSWVVVLLLQAVLVVSGIAAMRTGEAQEERVEQVVSGAVIHEHEEAAEAFVWASAAVLAVMVLPLLASRRRAGLPLAILSMVGTLIVLGLGIRTGDAGGRLVYQYGAANAYLQPSAQSSSAVPGGRDAHGEENSDDH